MNCLLNIIKDQMIKQAINSLFLKCFNNFLQEVSNVTGLSVQVLIELFNTYDTVCHFGGNMKRLCQEKECTNCLNRSFESSARSKYWNYEMNSKTPRYVSLCNNKKFWFTCGECKHDFQAIPGNIKIYNSWCPYCGNNKLCGIKDCMVCLPKSFASSDRAAYWNYERNKIEPISVTLNCNKKFWFTCSECKHDFEAELNSVTSRNRWCPYCVNQKLCNNEQCNMCLDKSFKSSDKAKYWDSEKNDAKPRDVFLCSNKKFWFVCRECKHSIQTVPRNVTRNGNWCAYCTHQKLCENKICDFCYTNSFASSDKIIHWNVKKNSNINPRTVFKSSSKKYWFTCGKCKYDFIVALGHVTNGKWCPKCKNKTEKLLYTFITSMFPDTVTQKTFDWCRNPETNRLLPFDFYIQSLNIIIELDGQQHFTQVSNWKCPVVQNIRDKYKMDLALRNGLSVIRILQTDVYSDKNNWKNLLTKSMIKYDSPDIILIGTDNILHKTFGPLELVLED